jgi:hypothetical protein
MQNNFDDPLKHSAAKGIRAKVINKHCILSTNTGIAGIGICKPFY